MRRTARGRCPPSRAETTAQGLSRSDQCVPVQHPTGWPDRPPLRVGLSIGDSIAALYATIGTLLALRVAEQTGRGQVVDVALSESVFSMLESIVPEYGYDGRVRERTGNMLGGAAPTNMYPTADERWLAIGANGDGKIGRAHV